MNAGVKISLEWEDPGAARGDELRATWCRLVIAINDRCATRVADSAAANSVRDGVYGPAYPLAEWIAANWWFLQLESDESRVGFSRRHGIRMACEGFALPDMKLSCNGMYCQVEASPWSPTSAPVRFLEVISAQVEQKQLFNELRSFVDAVCGRLEGENIRGTLLQDEWASVKEVESDDEQLVFCQTAAAMGHDPFDISEELANSIIESHAMLGDDIWSDFSAATSPERATTTARWILDAQTILRHKAIAKPRFGSDMLRADSILGNAWQQGYEGARRLLGSDLPSTIGGSRKLELQSVLQLIGSDLPAVTLSHGPSPAITGMVWLADGDGFTVGTSTKREDNQRFMIARSLAEFLWNGHSGSRALLTRTQTFRQQRNRAFAAELLAPSSVLREQLSGSIINGDEIGDLAVDFGVSEYVVSHQIQNHNLATIQ